MSATSLGLSEKQQQLRMTGVGASEVWDVLNGGILTYARKVGEAEPFEGNSLTEFGHRIERVIAEAYAERHPGVRVFTPGTLRHPTHEWALATLDRVVAPPGIGRPARAQWIGGLEIKVSFFSDSDYGEGADDVPEKYAVQVQWQMEVADLEQVTLVALVRGDYREYPIKRDREMGAMLLAIVGRFWRDNVLARVPPPVDGSKAYTDYLRGRHPKEAGPVIAPTPEAVDVVARLRAAQAESKRAEKAEELVKQQLLQLVGDAAGIEGLCSFKANKDSERTDLDAAADGFIIRLCENPLSGGYSLPREKITALWAEVQRDFTIIKPGARVLRLSKEK